MELNVIRRYAVDLSFGYRQFRKNICRELLGSAAEIALTNHR